jgi:predicted Rossmann-fold nucleotide-binding protein
MNKHRIEHLVHQSYLCLPRKIQIELQLEQAVSPSIDTNTMMRTFVIRRTSLIWNTRGIAVLPGGLGTVNKLFEALVGAADHKVVCPIVVVPESFYMPLLDAIEKAAVLTGVR